MISIAIMAETPEELAEAVRKLTEPDKLFVSASEVKSAIGFDGAEFPPPPPQPQQAQNLARRAS